MKVPSGYGGKRLWTRHAVCDGLPVILHRFRPWFPVRWDVPLWCYPCNCDFCCRLFVRFEKMKVPMVGMGAESPDGSWLPSVLLKELPTLDTVTGDPSWDGAMRKGERALFVFWDVAGSVRVILKVGNPAVKLSTSAGSLDDAMAALELCLEGDDVPWQGDERPLKGPPKKKK